ncbi:hypothetical protein MNBD_GAMMA12-3821 [hydrothermal vent metagenome]|uniref:Uncharacterized protein n=1 Tax=hydrothermal vent metagenome TaxID=652676 RepID=A0A3B0Y7K0_9ZZZZ
MSSRSRGGLDGVYLLDRDFKPANSMMKKLFDQFLDKPNSLLTHISKVFNVTYSELLPIRLVSHHMRLLGVMAHRNKKLCLVLVDYDNDK